MAAHNLIKYVVRQRPNGNFLVIAADGSLFLFADDGEFLSVLNSKTDPIALIHDTRKEGPIVALDTLPAPVVEYLNSLYMLHRFPKCVEMLTRIPKGGAKIASFEPREKQLLNELIRHGLIRKSKQNYLIA